MIQFDVSSWEQLTDVAESKNVYISGTILRIIDPGTEPQYREYLDKAIEKDATKQRRRLEVNKKTQAIMAEHQKAKEENDRLVDEIKAALADAEESQQQEELARAEAERLRESAEEATERAEHAREIAEGQLETARKKKQFELMGQIVSVALWVICGVGLITTTLYFYAIHNDSSEVTLLGNTWSNMFGILLTNSFSIIGTVMGVKYATERSGDSEA